VVLAIGDELINRGPKKYARLSTKALVAAPYGREGRPEGMELESGQTSTPAIDLGMVGILTTEDQRHVAENLLAFLRRDYRRAAEQHVEIGWQPGNIWVALSRPIPHWPNLHTRTVGAGNRIQAADAQSRKPAGLASELPAVGGDAYAFLNLIELLVKPRSSRSC